MKADAAANSVVVAKFWLDLIHIMSFLAAAWNQTWSRKR